MITTQSPTACPCGSQLAYTHCRGPFHDGKSPETAVELMRSRYSAYALGNVDYIISTTLPPQQPALKKEKALLKADTTHWLRLAIIKTTKGSIKDKSGVVEFKAWYIAAPGQREQFLHEVSDFIKKQGRWYYIHPSLPKAPKGNR